jgi:hypothetical protein
MRLLLALALFSLFSNVEAQDLGRLFFTPEQRAALDARRKARVPDKPAAAAVVASPTTRLDGYVKRSIGPSTVWVNGESLNETPRERDGRVAVPRGDSGARVGMKPGEVLNRGTGEVRDVIGEGEIRIRRRVE